MENSRPAEMTEATILVVDDTPFDRVLISELLRDRYSVICAESGREAFDIIATGALPDLVLLDVLMADMDGHEVCRRLKSNPATANIPVIFLTSNTAQEDEEFGFELGAVDYITKPIRKNVALARVRAQLQLKCASDQLEYKALFLEQEVQRRAQDIEAIQDVTILALASLAEIRDNETGNHLRRTQHYARALAEQMKKSPRFSRLLSKQRIDMLFRSVPLHDIGKVGIPDHILLKPGRFTPDEFEVMKTHTTLGRDAIANAELRVGVAVEFLHIAKEVAYSHHEKWDGSGYPEGLAGEDIPLSARIMAVADVYDALISRRPYKQPVTHARAVQMITEGRGSQFDPAIVDAFIEIQERFLEINRQYTDSDDDIEEKTRQVDLVLSLQAEGRTNAA